MKLKASLFLLALLSLAGLTAEANAQYVSQGYGQTFANGSQVVRFGTPLHGIRYNGNVARIGTRSAGVLVGTQSVRIGTPLWGVQFGGGNLQVGRLNRR